MFSCFNVNVSLAFNLDGKGTIGCVVYGVIFYAVLIATVTIVNDRFF